MTMRNKIEKTPTERRHAAAEAAVSMSVKLANEEREETFAYVKHVLVSL